MDEYTGNPKYMRTLPFKKALAWLMILAYALLLIKYGQPLYQISQIWWSENSPDAIKAQMRNRR